MMMYSGSSFVFGQVMKKWSHANHTELDGSKVFSIQIYPMKQHLGGMRNTREGGWRKVSWRQRHFGQLLESIFPG
ncbi:hypothetical protein YC2023_032860 [Brassica napus]